MTIINQTTKTKNLGNYQAELEAATVKFTVAQTKFAAAKTALEEAELAHIKAMVALSEEIDRVTKACKVAPLGA